MIYWILNLSENIFETPFVDLLLKTIIRYRSIFFSIQILPVRILPQWKMLIYYTRGTGIHMVTQYVMNASILCNYLGM